MIEQAHGIPAGLLDVQTDASGAAIVQANAPLAEHREKRGKVFRKPENDFLHHTIKLLAGRDKRVPVGIDPMRYTVSVRYSDPAASMSVTDKNERQKFLIEIGVLTPGDIAVEEFPGKYKDAAEANKEIGARNEEKKAEEMERMEAEAKISAANAPTKPMPMEE